jgi:hypothetical protein
VETGELLGRAGDITPEGIRMTTRKPLEPGRALTIRVRLPAAILGKTVVEAEAECRWCRRAENPALYDTGLKFRTMAPDDIEVVEEVIQRFGR